MPKLNFIPKFHHKRVIGYTILIFIILGNSISGYANQNTTINNVYEGSNLQILTTIAVPYDLILSITGELADVESIVDSSTDIHSFEGPTIQQIQSMLDADVIFSMGVAGAEPWLASIVEDNPILTEKIIPLGNMTEDGYADPLLNNSINPHIWMNPNVIKKMVAKATNILIELDSPHTTEFTQNNETFQNKLSNLLNNIESNKTEYFNGLKVVVGHPAFYYLFDLLGINRIAAIELQSGGEPGQATIYNIIELMKEENCSLIVTTPQHSDKDSLEIARATGAKIAKMSAIPGIYEDFQVLDYISMIEYCMTSLRNPKEVEMENAISGFDLWTIMGALGVTAIFLTIDKERK